ncbi:hypothetical protein [Tenacibaculum sp. SG-28]|uniref:hypothetical protein n=1 Tax=Tenacibaculum sp. SG-28 TaxID=754426 RepID=UPI000CF54274|nr:hypothetical protein [Tenacibaculum sp. SG-28]PQJ21962.1 hypothetical protein BSU00_08090 [Tenacibaculum sp. SG-28]
MKYVIVNKSGIVALSNLNDEKLISEIQKCQKEFERVKCPISGKYRRQGLLSLPNHNIFISTDEDITNKIFKHKLSGVKILGDLLDNDITRVKHIESQKTRRLKHNLINHNSNILQELFKLIPQDAFKAQANHVDIIQKLISSNPRKGAFTYLKVLKSANLMKAEFEVYEMFNTVNPYLDFLNHPIHKILVLTLNPFWLDLVEQNVNINIAPCFDKVYVDYKSISVALSHVFDNIAKYVMPHSDLVISFQNEAGFVCVQMNMQSLKVEENEIQELFTETKSGKWAKELELDGDGIGMFAINKLITLNEGSVEFIKDFNGRGQILIDGVPYENNQLIIKLKKSA